MAYESHHEDRGHVLGLGPDEVEQHEEGERPEESLWTAEDFRQRCPKQWAECLTCSPVSKGLTTRYMDGDRNAPSM